MKIRFYVLVTLAALTSFLLSSSALSSPVGTWITVDDKNEHKGSLVELWLDQGELKGRVVKLLNPADSGKLCGKCKGAKHNQPIEGMEIIWGLHQQEQQWRDGYVMDPKSGKTYSAKLSLSDDGQSLKLRGYLGVSLLGRSQTWHRAEQNQLN
ncbi:DUF2147 domain-containing protein [Agaribacterium haliotis]|uniref:DUF2147 domain-containing protein n=1 Tax=Agaribacterium haliotis TaxID=2013869 RepID=UPI000BB57E98|nr:DUF2147 domain-containing protein [Agaribacterium haliotis]